MVNAASKTEKIMLARDCILRGLVPFARLRPQQRHRALRTIGKLKQENQRKPRTELEHGHVDIFSKNSTVQPAAADLDFRRTRRATASGGVATDASESVDEALEMRRLKLRTIDDKETKLVTTISDQKHHLDRPMRDELSTLR